jgi:isopentenyl-diphosphate Delta-isomerase
MEKIILVDEEDNEIGTDEKLKVHREGALHRAFSSLIVNPAGNKMLLQKRHRSKYHSGGLWTNACCSHPRSGEIIEDAAHRRLLEEMGFDCFLQEIFSIRYFKSFENGLIENEYDHVYLGIYDGKVTFDINEAEDFIWLDIDILRSDVKRNPAKYTYWFALAFDKYLSLLM